MSGFSPEWLALREGADRLARAATLLDVLRERLAGRSTLTIADIGCGTGSTIRTIARLLPERQAWHLYDYDGALLEAARAALARWAGADPHAGGDAGSITLSRDGRVIDVRLHRLDLVAELACVFDPPPDLVTASAFFDLVSAEWIDAFVRKAAAARAAVYAAITYNGEEVWEPPHPADAAVLAAFHAHQRTDKGFGPAAGPAAAGHLAGALAAAGYDVLTADSPWQLGEGDESLIEAIAMGSADAVAETGLVPAHELSAWRDARLRAIRCRIGHTDILAWPDARPH
jgi:SAM-dependent methyltransferase